MFLKLLFFLAEVVIGRWEAEDSSTNRTGLWGCWRNSGC